MIIFTGIDSSYVGDLVTNGHDLLLKELAEKAAFQHFMFEFFVHGVKTNIMILSFCTSNLFKLQNYSSREPTNSQTELKNFCRPQPNRALSCSQN